jgi:hypothetical protein
MKFADKSAVMPTNYCPICGKKLDRAGLVSKTGEYGEPSPGALTVCFGCGGWLVFRKDLSLRKMDAEDIRQIDSETHQMLMTISRAIKEVKETK